MKKFLSKVDHDRVVAAIRDAEAKSSGEIRVHLDHRRVADPLAEGRAVFERLGMTSTADRNGALIFVSPRSKKFAILGDTAIHEKCGDDFWASAAEALSGHFRGGRFTEGLIDAIARLGNVLAKHFPPKAARTNAIADTVDES